VTNEDFEQVYYPKYVNVIKAIARKLARRNTQLAEDLCQEGLIALWHLEPERARGNLDAFVRQAVKFRMIDYMRRERPAVFESLCARLERGDQMVQDPDTGDLHCIASPVWKDYWDRPTSGQEQAGDSTHPSFLGEE